MSEPLNPVDVITVTFDLAGMQPDKLAWCLSHSIEAADESSAYLTARALRNLGKALVMVAEDRRHAVPTLPKRNIGMGRPGNKLPSIPSLVIAILHLAEQPLPLREVHQRVQNAVPGWHVSLGAVSYALHRLGKSGHVLRTGERWHSLFELVCS